LLTFTIAWVAVAIVATMAAWQGVALVTDEVTDDRPAALAASDVQARLDGEAAATGDTTTPGSDASDASDSTAGTTTTSATSSATTTAPAQPAPVTKSYLLTGGSVTIRFSPTEVTATGVFPNPGFSIKKNGPEDGGWRVEFESDAHRSRIDAWWDGGPQVRPREDPR
jgi:hypothetical protein